MTHLFLALASLALVLMIGAQDYLVPALRNETISSGLTGPDHWWLDLTYLILAVALVLPFSGLAEVLAVLSAIALLLTAATNTFGVWVDKITGGKHSIWHSRATLAVFSSAVALQLASDHGWLWILTAATVIFPASAYLYFRFEEAEIDGVTVAASPAAEKLFVLFLCVWLIAWAM